MTIEEQATKLSHPEIVFLLREKQSLEAKLATTEQQLNWFKKQIFGQKSEKREYVVDPRQLSLGELQSAREAPEQKQEVKAYERGKAKKQPLEGSPEDSGLRFGPDVPVKEILLPCPEIDNLDPSEYTELSREHSFKLAQKPAAYIVLKFIRRTAKINEKSQPRIISTPAPDAVIEKSFADVSFLAGMLIDKILYHLPLYRQHQRLENFGIILSRATLTNLFHRSVDLLEPIYKAQLSSILASKVICMDETPVKAARAHSGKMKTSYYWPIYGDQDEVCFEWRESREHRHVKEILHGYNGVLLADGYQAYDKYSAETLGCTRAQCWNHARREFVEALPYEPELSQKALDFIGELYKHEELIKNNRLNDTQKQLYRVENSKPVVETLFNWLTSKMAELALLPTNPFTKAANYVLNRQEPLKVFLLFPEVQIDTNHQERQIRSIAVGRKNWNFCWTEIGAKYVGIVQSLIRTCILHKVNPYQYLVDVLQRIDVTSNSDIALLTPRLWKINFTEERFISWVDLHSD